MIDYPKGFVPYYIDHNGVCTNCFGEGRYGSKQASGLFRKFNGSGDIKSDPPDDED